MILLAIFWRQEYTFFEKKTKTLRDYDRALLGFRYGEALDLVLKNGDSILIKTLLTELKHRAALPQAVHNRNPETLLPILQWMQKNFNDPRYTGIIIDVMYEILGTTPMYASYNRYLWSGSAGRPECRICGRGHNEESWWWCWPGEDFENVNWDVGDDCKLDFGIWSKIPGRGNIWMNTKYPIQVRDIGICRRITFACRKSLVHGSSSVFCISVI